jgi:tungstate transport system substrate-binding protein
MKKVFLTVLSLLLVLSMLVGCTKANKEPIILSTTTSTQDSGLLDFLLPIFTEDTGIEVKTVAVGTGKALQMGRDGEADILLVHAKSDELTFVDEGHGTERHDVMYNDYILVGPADDTLGLKAQFPNDIVGGLKAISENGAIFVSRGDDSGTHKKELSIWKVAEIEPKGDWYLSAGAGMGEVLRIASEKQGYTISDRATYLSQKDNLDLEIIIEGDNNLFNQYGIIPVNPDKNDNINHEGAMEFMNWMISEKGQALIKEFGVEEFGQSLFTPNAN